MMNEDQKALARFVEFYDDFEHRLVEGKPLTPILRHLNSVSVLDLASQDTNGLALFFSKEGENPERHNRQQQRWHQKGYLVVPVHNGAYAFMLLERYVYGDNVPDPLKELGPALKRLRR